MLSLWDVVVPDHGIRIDRVKGHIAPVGASNVRNADSIEVPPHLGKGSQTKSLPIINSALPTQNPSSNLTTGCASVNARTKEAGLVGVCLGRKPLLLKVIHDELFDEAATVHL